MAKKNKTEQPKDTGAPSIIHIPIFGNKKNEPVLRIPPEHLQSILEYCNVKKEFEIVALECENGRLQLISSNSTNNGMVHYIGMPDNTEIVNDGYYIFDVKKALNGLGRKCKNADLIEVKWPKGNKISFETIEGKGGSFNHTPKALSELNVPRLDRRFPFIDGHLQFNKKDEQKTVMKGGAIVTENAITMVKINQDELLKGADDMAVAEVDYIIFTFEKDGSSCEAGSWNAKGDTSLTPDLEIESFEGEPLEKAMPEIFLEFAKKLPGVIDLQGDHRKLYVSISQSKPSEEIHYIVSQNNKK